MIKSVNLFFLCKSCWLKPQLWILGLLGALSALAAVPISVSAAVESLLLSSSPVVSLRHSDVDFADIQIVLALQLEERHAIDALLHAALTSAHSLANPTDQLYPLVQIAETYQLLGDHEAAIILIGAAMPLIEQVDNPDAQISLLVSMAQIYIDAGNSEVALPLLQRALGQIVEVDDNSYFLLSDFVASTSRLADRQQAANVLISVLDTVPELSVQQQRLLNDIVVSVESWPGTTANEVAAAQVLARSLQMVDQLSKSQAVITAPGLPARMSILLGKIATTLGSFAESSQALPLLDALIAAVDTIPEPRYRAEVLSAIAAAYISLDQTQIGRDFLDTAVATAMEEPWVNSQAQALAEIASTANNYGYDQQAVDALTLAMDAIAPAVEAGEADTYERGLEVTVQVAAQLHDPQQSIATLENAIALTRSITMPYAKAQVLRTVVHSIEKWDHQQYNRELLLLILESLESLQSQSSAYEDELLALEMIPPDNFGDGPPPITPGLGREFPALISQVITLALALEQSHDRLAVLEQVIQTVVATDDAYRFNSLSDIAAAAIQLNNPDQAEQILEQVLTAAESAELSTRASTYGSVVDAYGELGNESLRQDVLTLAMTTIEQIPDQWQRYVQLSTLPVRAVALTHQDAAEQLLLRVIAQIGTIEREDYRANLLGYLSTALDDGQLVVTQQIVDQAYPLAAELSDPAAKTKGLIAIAHASMGAELSTSQTLELLEQAITLLPEIQASERYQWARDIFTIYSHLGAHDQGISLLNQLISIKVETSQTETSPFAIARTTLEINHSLVHGGTSVNAPQQVQAALDSTLEIFHNWSRDWTRDAVTQIPGFPLHEYGQIPEQQLENLFQEHQALILASIPIMLIETSGLLEKQPMTSNSEFSQMIDRALMTTMDSAQSMTSPEERFVPLRFVAIAALHLGKTDLVSDVLVLAVPALSEIEMDNFLSEFQEPTYNGFYQDLTLNHADFKTTADILTATIHKMNTLSDENRSLALSQIVLYVQDAIQEFGAVEEHGLS